MYEKYDEELKNRFLEGIAMGMGAATIVFVFLALLFPVMFTFN